METSRVESIARDGIQTASQIARTLVQSGGEVAGDLIGLARATLGGVIEAAGTLARTAVRVSAEVVNEVVHSVRSMVYVIVPAPDDRGRPTATAARPANGHTLELPA